MSTLKAQIRMSVKTTINLDLSFEILKLFFRDYEKSKKTAEIAGLTKDGSFKAEDDKTYTFPNELEVLKRLEAQIELLEKKISQYKNPRILITPLTSLLGEFEVYTNLLRKYEKEGKLHSINEDGSRYEISEKAETFKKTEPLWVWGNYKTESLVYDPKEYDKDPKVHQGKSKKEITKENNGFSIILIDDTPLKKKNETPEIINGRSEILGGQTPIQYLLLQKEEQYTGEVGLYPEEIWFKTISKLIEEDGLVVNDYKGKGCTEGALGAVFGSSLGIPGSCWNRDDSLAYAYRWYIGDSVMDCAVSLGVRN